MAKTHGMEAYLTAIYTLEAEDGVVLASSVADYLHVSRPTVTQTIHRLTALELVQSGLSKEIMLTATGREKAEQVVRRHRLLERWLSDDLGIEWAQAHEEADRLEHAISPLVEKKLMQKLGFPTTCPHGNAIPGSGKSQPQGARLGDCASGAIVNVVPIVEKAEENRELLSKFYEYGLTPGATIHVIRREEIPQHDVEIHFRVHDRSCMLTKSMARWIVIAPIGE